MANSPQRQADNDPYDGYEEDLNFADFGSSNPFSQGGYSEHVNYECEEDIVVNSPYPFEQYPSFVPRNAGNPLVDPQLQGQRREYHSALSLQDQSNSRGYGNDQVYSAPTRPEQVSFPQSSDRPIPDQINGGTARQRSTQVNETVARQHGGKPRVECSFPGCPINFSRSADMRRHYLDQHQRHRYRCAFCPKEFSRQYKRVNHARKIHGVEITGNQ